MIGWTVHFTLESSDADAISRRVHAKDNLPEHRSCAKSTQRLLHGLRSGAAIRDLAERQRPVPCERSHVDDATLRSLPGGSCADYPYPTALPAFRVSGSPPIYYHNYRGPTMRKLTSPGAAQQFLSAFSGISLHFRPRRHRLHADEYRRDGHPIHELEPGRRPVYHRLTQVTTQPHPGPEQPRSPPSPVRLLSQHFGCRACRLDCGVCLVARARPWVGGGKHKEGQP
jgi:hypothetical protein